MAKDTFLHRDVETPSVVMLSLGGTIASVPSAGVEGAVPSMSAKDVLGDLDTGGVNVVTSSFRQMPGAHLAVDDLLSLAAELIRYFDSGVSGAVVTQGTDTIEETAFALDVLVPHDNPVVVTGAMRGPTVEGADGSANVKAAIAVAAAEEARGLGTLVVMNDQIHAARFVRKGHTTNTGAFISPTAGPLGWISEARVHIAFRPIDRLGIPGVPVAGRSSVALVAHSLGDDGRLARAALEGGFAGIVVEATGGGHVSLDLAQILAEAAAEIPVVIASRTGAGSTLKHTYGFKGSEIDLQRHGVIFAGWLDGPKARLYLDILMRVGVSDIRSVRTRFERFSK